MAAGSGTAEAASLAEAPLLVALCDTSSKTAGGPAAWMAAAQMAMAAEEWGLAALVFPSPPGALAPQSLSLPEGGRIEAVLALGLAGQGQDRSTRGPELHGAEGFLAAAPPRRHGRTGDPDRQILLSFTEIASATAAGSDMDGVLETIVRSLGRLFPIDGAALGLLEDDVVLVREILRRGEAVRREPESLPADGSHLLGWVITNERPLWRNDVASELRFQESLAEGGMRSDMTIPLRARRRVTGAFRVACRRRHAFEPEDFETLKRCSDLTAVAIETQRLLLATQRLSEVDGLTAVYNHRYFLELLTQEVERARRTRRPVSLLMMDLDDFKKINDRHGHPAGDRTLHHVAQLIAKVLRRSDVVARYGGEEFVAILPDAGLEAAMAVAEKVRAEVERSPLSLPGLPGPLHVRISLGVASLPEDAATEADLVEAADRGLYHAKRTGKNRVGHV